MPRPLPWFEGVDPLLPSEIKPLLYQFDEYQTYDLIYFVESGRIPLPSLAGVNQSQFHLLTGTSLVDRFVPVDLPWADQFVVRWHEFWSRWANEIVRPIALIPAASTTELRLRLTRPATLTWLRVEQGPQCPEFMRRHFRMAADVDLALSLEDAALFSLVASGEGASEVEAAITDQLINWLLYSSWRELVERIPEDERELEDNEIVAVLTDLISWRWYPIVWEEFYTNYFYSLDPFPDLFRTTSHQNLFVATSSSQIAWQEQGEPKVYTYPLDRPAHPLSPAINEVFLIAANNNRWGFTDATEDVGSVCLYEGGIWLPCREGDFYFKNGFTVSPIISYSTSQEFDYITERSGIQNYLVRYFVGPGFIFEKELLGEDIFTPPLFTPSSPPVIPSFVGGVQLVIPPSEPSPTVRVRNFQLQSTILEPLPEGWNLVPPEADDTLVTIPAAFLDGTRSGNTVAWRRRIIDHEQFGGWEVIPNDPDWDEDPWLKPMNEEVYIDQLDSIRYAEISIGEFEVSMPDSVRVKEIHAALEADFFGSGANFKMVIQPDGNTFEVPNTVARQVEATQEAIQGFNFPGSFQSYRLRTTPDGVEQQDPANVNHLPALLYKIYEELALVLGPGAISDDAGDGFSRIEYQSIQDQIDDVLTNQSAQFGLTSSLSVETKRTLWILAQVLKAIGVPCEVQELELTGLGKVAVPRVSDSARSIRQSIDDIQLNLTPKI